MLLLPPLKCLSLTQLHHFVFFWHFWRRENSYNGYPLHSLIQNDIEMVNRQNSCGPIGPIDDIAGEEDLSGMHDGTYICKIYMIKF